MKSKLLIMIFFTTSIWANFNFGECSGSGSFKQQILHYNGSYENAILVGVIPAGIEGLRIELASDKDVDIRLYGENSDKIVHWPHGLMSKKDKQKAAYHDTNISYSGYNGVDGEKGNEYIVVHGTTPTAMTMKAFGYRAGYAIVDYSWSGKSGCSPDSNGTGSFVQEIETNATTLVGTIPPNVDRVQINLASSNDIDIQLYGKDGTAIVSWKPHGLLDGDGVQTLVYHDMNITWSGYLGVGGHAGHEYIKIEPKSTERLTMKVFGYRAGTADVTYTWGEQEALPQGNELMHSAGNELGKIDKGSHWSTYGQGWDMQTRSYNGKLFLYSTNKEVGAGIYQEFATEIGREYEVRAILLGSDTNRDEAWNGESFVTISRELPQIDGANIVRESAHVTGGVEQGVKFRFRAESSISYLAIRSSGIWLYASARAISVKAVDNKPVEDKTPPIITMHGYNASVIVGTKYRDKGASATDNIDGNITQAIRVTSDLNMSKIGLYHLYYDVNDSAGNSAIQVVREIAVRGKNQKPKQNEVTIAGSDTKYANIQDAVNASKDNDAILIENGRYEAGIVLDKNLILRNAEGANSVVITGEKSLNQWEYDSATELYVATSPCADVQMLFVGGVQMMAARYPNSGYFTVNDAPSKSKFSLLDFNMTHEDMKDSVAHVRMSQWRLASRRVQSYEEGYVNLISEAISDSHTITPEYKIFFTQVVSAIDSDGEWAWNDNKIYMKSSETPENVTVACSEYGIYLDANAKNVEISGLHIEKIKGHGITKKRDTRKSSSDDIVIRNNTVSYTSGWGITLRDFYKRYERLPADTRIEGNKVHHTREGGIQIFADNARISGNYVHDIGVSKLNGDVLAHGSSNMLSGIFVTNSSGARVFDNRLNNIGYNGISLANSWSGWMSNGDRVVEHNYVSNALLALNDGGCIYTYVGKAHDVERGVEPERDIIRNNIVENCIGSFAGTNQPDTSHRAGEGIYLDNDSSFVDIYGNTVIGATKSLFLNSGSYDVNVTRNSLVSPFEKSIYIRESNGENKKSVSITNNKILSGNKWTYQLIYKGGVESLLMDIGSNIFRVDAKVQVKHGYGLHVDTESFEIWQESGFDVTSVGIYDSTKPVTLINPSQNDALFKHLEGCRGFDNTPLKGTVVTLAPYASLLLFGCTNYTPATYLTSQ